MKILVLLLFLLVGCKAAEPIYVPEIISNKETTYKYMRDTVYVRDSIDRYHKGDTFYIIKTKEVYKYKFSVDTFIKVDSIPVIVTKTEYVEKEKSGPNGFEWFLIWAGILALVYIIIKRVMTKVI